MAFRKGQGKNRAQLFFQRVDSEKRLGLNCKSLEATVVLEITEMSLILHTAQAIKLYLGVAASVYPFGIIGLFGNRS